MNDLVLVCGFVKALSLVLRIQYKGLLWIALPCGSFTFMSSSGHCRTAFNPYGNCQRAFVLTGNLICSRTCILILVALSRSVSYFLENPLNSTVNFWPFIHYLMGLPALGGQRSSWQLSLLLLVHHSSSFPVGLRKHAKGTPWEIPCWAFSFVGAVVESQQESCYVFVLGTKDGSC